MIKIRRSICPNQLNTAHRNLVEGDYQHADVVSALLSMQHFKCCFCEKSLPPLGRTARWVEHFVAKTDPGFKKADGRINWNQANAWNNLLYSCSTCNGSKGTIAPFSPSGRRQLIDPSYSRIDPESHIEFFIDDVLIFYKECSTSLLGKNTISNLKLKIRTDVYSFLRKSKLEIDYLFSEMVDALTDGNLIVADSKLASLRRMTSASESHTSFKRKYLLKKIIKFNSDLPVINHHTGTHIAPINIVIGVGSEIIA